MGFMFLDPVRSYEKNYSFLRSSLPGREPYDALDAMADLVMNPLVDKTPELMVSQIPMAIKLFTMQASSLPFPQNARYLGYSLLATKAIFDQKDRLQQKFSSCAANEGRLLEKYPRTWLHLFKKLNPENYKIMKESSFLEAFSGIEIP